MPELKKCPACGHAGTRRTVEVDDHCSCGMPFCRSHEEDIVECDYCSFSAEYEDWQNRPTEDALRAENERRGELLENVISEVAHFGYPESTPNAVGQAVSTEPEPAQLVEHAINTLKAENARLQKRVGELELYLALERECWDLRCIDIPSFCDDKEVGWIVIEHYMAEPKEREVGFGSSPVEAIRMALTTPAEEE